MKSEIEEKWVAVLIVDGWRLWYRIRWKLGKCSNAVAAELGAWYGMHVCIEHDCRCPSL
jgi:hypothetical protein